MILMPKHTIPPCPPIHGCRKEIKTIFDYNADAFDTAVNKAIADDFNLIRRDVIHLNETTKLSLIHI